MEPKLRFLPPKVGTKAKLLLGCTLPNGVNLSDCDFEVELSTQYKKRTYKKSELLPADDDQHYYVLVDTKDLGPGHYKCTLLVLVPDADFVDGIRPEKIEFPTDLNVIP